MSVLDRFEQIVGHKVVHESPEAATDALFELMVDLTRAHATSLGVEGVAPVGSVLLACPRCGGRVLGLADVSERAACAAGCGWSGTVAEACA